MSVFTIGRVGVDVASGGDGTTLQHPFEWVQQGRMVTLAGVHQAASDAAAVWLQQQILGLDPANNPDEEWVPVTSSTAADLNGFFRIDSASAVIPKGSLGNGSKIVQWSVQMERAPAWRRPRIDIPSIYAGLTNSMGVTTRTDTASVPTGTGETASSWTTSQRTTEHGVLDTRWYEGSVISFVYQTTASAGWAPGSHYSGSAYIERAGVGRVVGRMDGPASDGFRVGNGLVRMGPDTSGNTFTFQFWNGSAWTGTKTLDFDNYAGVSIVTPRRVSVIRNDPAVCVIRVGCTQSLSNAITIDMAVRRGDRFVRLFCAGDLSEMRMKFAVNTACTATTWGLRTSSLVNSQYLVLMSDVASVKTTPGTNGKLQVPNAIADSEVVFGVGASGNGATAPAPDGADSVSSQFFAVAGESQRVTF